MRLCNADPNQISQQAINPTSGGMRRTEQSPLFDNRRLEPFDDIPSDPEIDPQASPRRAAKPRFCRL
jgi:hypothetical protein